MNLTWSFMKVQLHCQIEEGKWAIYAAQEVKPWEAHVRDFINKPNVPTSSNTLVPNMKLQTVKPLPTPSFYDTYLRTGGML